MAALRLGIVGAGDVARYAHMPAFWENPRVEVMAISDPNVAAANSVAQDFGIPNVYADYSELLADASIEAVDVCAPHYLHHEIVMAALDAGKHVICEKPIAMNLDEADAMIARAQELGLRLLVVLNQRFLPIHQKVKEYIGSGKLGRPFLANGIILGNVIERMNDANSWKGTWEFAGGGVLFDTGTHMIDLMHYWFGQPTAVSAVVRRLVATPENKADDNASVVLEYPDMMANVLLSYSVDNEPWSEKKFVYGTGGDLSVISETAVPMFYVTENAPQLVDVEHSPAWAGWSHKMALAHLVDCIIDGTEPFVTPHDARAALRTILAAYEASASGCRVVLA